MTFVYNVILDIINVLEQTLIRLRLLHNCTREAIHAALFKILAPKSCCASDLADSVFSATRAIG